jgi:hypothetical protein
MALVAMLIQPSCWEHGKTVKETQAEYLQSEIQLIRAQNASTNRQKRARHLE